MSEGEGFDFRRNCTALTAADWFIGLGNEDTRLRAVIDEVAKSGDSDISGGDEGEGH